MGMHTILRGTDKLAGGEGGGNSAKTVLPPLSTRAYSLKGKYLLRRRKYFPSRVNSLPLEKILVPKNLKTGRHTCYLFQWSGGISTK